MENDEIPDHPPSAQLAYLNGDSEITKIDNSVLAVDTKSRIKLYKVNPVLHGARLVNGSPTLIKKRAKAFGLGINVPDWGNLPIHAPKDPVLTESHRNKLINYAGNIWFKNATDSDKNDFLNAVEMALSQLLSNKKVYPTDLTPKEQKERLQEIAAHLEKAKKELGLLSGMPLHQAENAHSTANATHQFSFHEVPSDFLMNDECEGDFNTMLTHTWMYLNDTVKTLKNAVEKVEISKQNKPSKNVNNIFIERLARTWKFLSGEYPPCSKDGSFFLFLQVLGELINEKFTIAEVARAVKKIRKIDEPPV